MPSSTSNFKRILRLPRLFFRPPTEAESVHGGPPLEYERPIPQIPWRGIAVVVVVVVFCPAGHAANGTWGKGCAPVSHPDACATRQPISRHPIGRACGVSQTGRTDPR